MIDYLIEIIFKRIRIEEIGRLLKDLISSGEKIENYNSTLEHSDFDWNDEKSIEIIFHKNENFGLFINLKKLNKYEIYLQNCGICVYKDENIINLEINFQLSDIKNWEKEDFVNKLMKLAKSLSSKYQIDDYLCGIEPAQEIKTRLFTNEKLGPFRFAN